MVIMLFALLFFGAKGIPDLARTLGRTMRQVRDASNEVQREIQRGANEVSNAVNEQRRSFQQSLESTFSSAWCLKRGVVMRYFGISAAKVCVKKGVPSKKHENLPSS